MGRLEERCGAGHCLTVDGDEAARCGVQLVQLRNLVDMVCNNAVARWGRR